jgi:hypothetical protein
MKESWRWGSFYKVSNQLGISMVLVNEGINALQNRMSEKDLSIVTLSHPCDRNILFLLNIKKPNMDVWLDTVNLNLTGTRS